MEKNGFFLDNNISVSLLKNTFRCETEKREEKLRQDQTIVAKKICQTLLSLQHIIVHDLKAVHIVLGNQQYCCCSGLAYSTVCFYCCFVVWPVLKQAKDTLKTNRNLQTLHTNNSSSDNSSSWTISSVITESVLSTSPLEFFLFLHNFTEKTTENIQIQQTLLFQPQMKF